MGKKLNLRDRLEDYTLDLSMSDLDEVPVKDIALIKKGTHLDLSINKITTLGNNFATLIHITKLDLSKNLLTTLPDNFGALVNLKHLDLYKNQIVHLPLSMSKLKALRWLDLKDNPLLPTLAEIAGPCLDQLQCQQCARKIVALLSDMQLKVEVEIVERKRKEAEAAQKKEELQKEETKKSNKKTKSQKGKDKDKKKENGVKNVVHASGDNLARRPIHVLAPKAPPVVKNKAKKPSGSFCGKFFKLLFMLVLASAFALTALWLLDKDMFVKVHRAAGDVWIQFVSQLPPPVVDVGNRAVEAARPTVEQACIHLSIVGKQISLKIQDGYSWLSSQEIVQQALTHTKKFSEEIFVKATELYKRVF